MKQTEVKYIIIFLITLVMGSCAPTPNKKEVEDTITVRTIIVKEEKHTKEIEYLAIVEPQLEVSLSFQVSGNTESVYVSEGEFVKKGQLLAQLSQGHLANSYNGNKAVYEQTKDAYDRLEKLYNNKSLPEIKFVEARSNMQQAYAQLQSAEKDIRDCHLYAPFDGVIKARHIEVGTNVNPIVPSFEIMKINKVKVKISIPEKDIRITDKGQSVSIDIPLLSKTFIGEISGKSYAANKLSHTYDIRVELPNENHLLLPGMVGTAHIVDKNTRSSIAIPSSCIQLMPNNINYAWIIDESNKARIREIEIGRQTSQGILVLNGIIPGDRIVIEGYQKLSEGVTVIEK